MAPIRRYLRISRHSVLECRVFLENPADEPRWLLKESDPALPRVFEAVKPLILLKLREENETARGKGKKKKTVKDSVKQDDFEVSIFLTEIRTRHSLLIKNKTFKQKPPIKTNDGGRLTRAAHQDSVWIRDEEDEHDVVLHDIPAVDDDMDAQQPFGDEDANPDAPLDDDKKKLGFKTTYEGFSIWGWVLCLFVERKGGPGQKNVGTEGNTQALMQDWIASTQQQKEDEF
ncbi:uncharacterized protein A1O9_00676 [Exophiala aquamarina CBS 119918]|uniref:Uncharacterized protein n=1 Tax=Exophiala aquamarina CBS 119918 TaxID=1182545 RepID=A0A072PTP3_9EURO|nr:uncharacterized protein A1O9_00676 [Exophiala aquamarina CBS 119918]KEF62703.1 hypothetical protein A1O9_00676 [Exophiala aquamarina CBS 119918]